MARIPRTNGARLTRVMRIRMPEKLHGDLLRLSKHLGIDMSDIARPAIALSVRRRLNRLRRPRA